MESREGHGTTVKLYLLLQNRKHRRPPNRHGRDMPGHDSWAACSWHFHLIVVPARGLGDCDAITPD